ncbi:MAG: hypothetical protein J7480_06790, partial [Microbacteriaceae bacterium]|nr:hypothetical protein [Microbacteriaceae bacterium]
MNLSELKILGIATGATALVVGAALGAGAVSDAMQGRGSAFAAPVTPVPADRAAQEPMELVAPPAPPPPAPAPEPVPEPEPEPVQPAPEPAPAPAPPPAAPAPPPAPFQP